MVAAIPNAAVEAYIAGSKDAGKPVSAKGVLAQAKPKKPTNKLTPLAPSVAVTEVALGKRAAEANAI
ncbi:hypothetical protein ACFS07_06520 [Undibacterium arcticum]